jgi:tetratricopeptide (TPR) repeat protein
MKLSCVLIVKDEDELLGKCLDSLYFEPVYDDWPCGRRPLWDELVIVDGGSTDRTLEIAEAHHARVEHFDWVNDFSAARNYAESICLGGYIYWQDADEVLLAGHEIIRAIVEKGEEVAIRPKMIFTRDEFGNPAQTYARQDLLHKKGSHVWKGAIHEWTEGPPGRIEDGILVEQLPRSGGDRSHGDMLEMLRRNLLDAPTERHFFYLAREHSYKAHHYEVIGLIDQLLALPVEWSIQRSHAAILKGNALKALNRQEDARGAYLQAVQEWGAWAEPYYALGVLHYELQQWAEGAAWFAACLPFGFPAGYFVDESFYTWRRYDMLAVCLSKIGRLEEAHYYGEKALAARPDDPHLQDNMQWYKAS